MLKQFWSFVRERESIRLRRAAGLPREQWTKDPVLAKYKFTNVKREHDRTTQGLKAIYNKHQRSWPDEIVLLNCALYRYFGTVEMAQALGWRTSWTKEDVLQVRKLAAHRLEAGERVFTGAYIVPNCGMEAPKYEVVTDIITGLWEAKFLAEQRSSTRVHKVSWQALVQDMTKLWGVGSFMAKEVVLDFALATDWRFTDWQTWTPVGPGARRGAYRVAHGNLDKEAGLSEPAALEVIKELYARRQGWWDDNPFHVPMPEVPNHGAFNGINRSVQPVVLDLTDLQFQLCEFDKYRRVVEGTGKPRNLFKPTEAT